MVLPKMSIRIPAIGGEWFVRWNGDLHDDIFTCCACSPFALQIPQHYTCFCKKELNPANHLWLVPHSCGELCEKPLKSQHGFCSHNCMILCHPGPCPPCSQTIVTSCECKKSNLRTIRCVQQSWKCGNKVSFFKNALLFRLLISMFMAN